MAGKKISDFAVNKYVHSQKEKTTIYQEKSDLNKFRRFCESIDERRQIEEIPAEDLDNILSRYFMNARTLKGELYETDTLSSFRNSLQRILDEKEVHLDLKGDVRFRNSTLVLIARRKELKKTWQRQQTECHTIFNIRRN